MNTITIECGKGLQAILVDILKPLSLRKSDGKTQYRATFELVGVEDNPIQLLKDYGHGVFECLNIISIN